MCQRSRPARTLSPTTAQPGTPEKIAVLAERVRLGLPLWHEGDPVCPGTWPARHRGRLNPCRGIKRRSHKYQVRVTVDGVRRAIGCYPSLEAAIAARDAAERAGPARRRRQLLDRMAGAR